MNLNTILSPNPSIIYTKMDNGEAVLLNMDTTKYFSLNQTGVRIWEGIEQGQSLDQIAEALTADFDVPLSHAQQSVLTLASELAEAGLVK